MAPILKTQPMLAPDPGKNPHVEREIHAICQDAQSYRADRAILEIAAARIVTLKATLRHVAQTNHNDHHLPMAWQICKSPACMIARSMLDG